MRGSRACLYRSTPIAGPTMKWQVAEALFAYRLGWLVGYPKRARIRLRQFPARRHAWADRRRRIDRCVPVGDARPVAGGLACGARTMAPPSCPLPPETGLGCTAFSSRPASGSSSQPSNAPRPGGLSELLVLELLERELELLDQLGPRLPSASRRTGLTSAAQAVCSVRTADRATDLTPLSAATPRWWSTTTPRPTAMASCRGLIRAA